MGTEPLWLFIALIVSCLFVHNLKMKASAARAPQNRKRILGTISDAPPTHKQLSIQTNNDFPSSLDDLQQQLWVDKYKPQRVDQLVVAPKKISEIRQFLESFSPSSYAPKLLILTGSPGIGKSTAVCLLAQELGLDILQWNHNSSSQYPSSGDKNHLSDFADAHPFASLSEFLHSASVGYQSIITSSSHSHHNTKDQKKSSSFYATSDSSLHPTRVLQDKKKKSKSTKENIKNVSIDDILSEDDDEKEEDCRHEKMKKSHGMDPSIFYSSRFITQSTTTHSLHHQKASVTQEKSHPPMRKLCYSSIILIEELPTLNTVERGEQLRLLMSNSISITQVPMILIFSDVFEGKYRPEELERIIDRTLLYSPVVSILEINPVTKPNIKKCVEHILQSEYKQQQRQKSLVSSKVQKRSLPTIDATWLDEIHSCTGGDLRQVIMTCQFLFSSSTTTRRRDEKKRETAQGSLENYSRDVTLSTFHALGKLLYAKRKVVGSVSSSPRKGGGRRPIISSSSSSSLNETNVDLPLDFDPEKVMEASSIGLSGALSFLGYHSPDFFTDISELSIAFDTMSDSAFFMDKLYTGLGSDSHYPSGYASSFASRAVANANKHPAPNKFRQFTSPKYFQVVRKREANKIKMSQMLRRISCCDEHLQMDVNVTTSNHFFMESFSFLHRILPLETQAIMEHMQHGEGYHENSEADYIASIRKQNEILQMDDIVDSDDDTNGKKKRNGVQL